LYKGHNYYMTRYLKLIRFVGFKLKTFPLERRRKSNFGKFSLGIRHYSSVISTRLYTSEILLKRDVNLIDMHILRFSSNLSPSLPPPRTINSKSEKAEHATLLIRTLLNYTIPVTISWRTQWIIVAILLLYRYVFLWRL